ncbi:MAG: hypothetical protein HOA17_00875 [Candidatus Melainabacteria bacterium]|jgi:flagellar hook protein FlgE|nr:hypothetical protein [Candidatus Melainabacteria bacterium]
MNRIQHLSRNATMNSVELMDTVSSNIFGYTMNGHRARRWTFNDFMNGGEINDGGYKMTQGKAEPRPGEWSKMMIRGRGFFSVKDPKHQETYYTRLGDFHLDGAGNMVSSEGFRLQAIPLAGAATHLNSPDPANPDYNQVNPNLVDPFNNPYTNNAQQINAPGQALGGVTDVNLGMDRRNGRYLGRYDSIKVGQDGVIYGRDGNNLVSLYRLSVVAFNNPNGLTNAKDGIYFKSSDSSGLPSYSVSGNIVVNEALEKSNSWVKLEAHYLTDAQRYFQAATQVHKLADKISGTAIEMIQ